MKRITVRDIAKQLNIAQGTVSKALGNKAGVSPELRQTILKAAEEMGYTANHLAQAMARAPVRIGIIMPNIWPNYYGVIIDGIRERLQMYSDYRIEAMYHYLPNLLAEEALKQCIDACIEEGVKVIILSASFNSSCAEHLNILKAKGIKLVLLGTDLPRSNRDTCVQINAVKAGMLAGEFADLVMSRSRKAAILIGSRQMLEHEEKLQGFIKAMEKANGEIVGIFETQDIPEIAEIIAKKIYAENPDLELIYIATSNSVAVCKILEDCDPERRIRIIATDVFSELIPYIMNGRVIASINQDLRRMGALAIEQSYKLLFQNDECLEKIKIEPILMLRTNILNDSELIG